MKPYYQKEEQCYLGSTKKALPAVANQQQEPKLPRERPILFSSEMVRAILEGRKTQTRRVGKMRGANRVYWHVGETHAWKGKPPQHYEGWVAEVASLRGLLLPLRCPFGQASDRLWVRETFTESRDKACVLYRADPMFDSTNVFDWKWSSSRFMPRRLSRITLEITGIRAERLQSISHEDALAEGMADEYIGNLIEDESFFSRANYRTLWDHIHIRNANVWWHENPWVWVIEFKRVGAGDA